MHQLSTSLRLGRLVYSENSPVALTTNIMLEGWLRVLRGFVASLAQKLHLEERDFVAGILNHHPANNMSKERLNQRRCRLLCLVLHLSGGGCVAVCLEYVLRAGKHFLFDLQLRLDVAP